MRALLFRKLVVEGINYYQLYKEDKEFEPNDDFADYVNRATKDFFYIDADGDIELEDTTRYNIFFDVDGKLRVFNDVNLFEKVFMEFKEKFHLAVREYKPMKEIVSELKSEILFQRYAIEDIVEQIYVNQGIMASDLPVELKLKLKNNILFHGPFGTGKKSIVEKLEKSLNIPYADITISSNYNLTLEKIASQLLSRSQNITEASYGIVYIRDNFVNLLGELGENAYTAPSFFSEQGIINYNGYPIDFRTLTFIVLMDDQVDMGVNAFDVESLMEMTNCTFVASTKALTNKEKYMILFSKKGRLRLYQEFMEAYGKKVIIEEKSLKRIISECSKIDLGMSVLNSIIDSIAKKSIMQGRDIEINSFCADAYLPALKLYTREETSNLPKKEDKPTTKDEIFDEELDKLASIITKDVIGQDKQVKTILYTLLQNRRMANKVGLDNPKKYINNILIRGESGSGKTMIVEHIAKILNIPFFIADSTQFTETGWVGGDVTDMLACLINAAGGDIAAAQKGILWIDEIDKKAGVDSQSQHSRGAVLDNLLKIVEGATISVNIGNKFQEEKILFDTSRLTVGLGGAFEGLEKIRDQRLGSNKMGFGRQETKNAPITGEDYVTYGMKKQFMARFPVRVELNKITKESLIRVMKESESSSLKTEKFKLEDRGIELEYSEDFYEALAEEVLKMEIGNRGIEAALSKVLDSINVIDIRASQVSKIILNKDVIANPSKVILVPREKQKKLEM